MKQKLLIVLILLCSLLSGGIGAYVFLTYFGQSTEITPEIEKVAVEIPQETESVMKDLENTITQEVQDVAPSVVSIIIKKDLVIYRSDPWGFFQEPVGTVNRQVGGGTGFFIRKDGVIITNKHVISDPNALYTVITNTGEEYDASVIATDPINDLALMQIDTDSQHQVLEFVQNLDEVQIGQFGIAIGNALAEFQNSVSLGIVSGKERTIEAGGQKLTGLIQTDTAINPGNSGGPLINLDGKVMGINTAIVNDSNGIGFAIALTQERVNYMLESVTNSGKIKRPFIGISYVPNSPGVQTELGLSVDYGAYIIDEAGSIIEGSSAEAAGIEPGDIILEIDGSKITLQNDLGSFIQNKIPGETLELKILKKSGEEKVVELELGEY